jgi:dienelactone hydrolase
MATGEPVMSLEQLANIATIVEAIAVVASLIFIGLQIRQSTKLAKATNVQSLVNLSSPFNLLLAQDRKLTEVWVKGSKQFDKLDEIDKTRYMFLLFHSMTLQEHIYYQRENHLIAESNYESWKRSFEIFIQEHNLWLHWDAI